MDQHEQQKRPVILTREELHARVWQTPISRLAFEFGVSDKGLAKICDRMHVPYPPRGYWAKKNAGKRVLSQRLPEATKPVPKNVTITPTAPRGRLSEMPAELREKFEAAQASLASIGVPVRLRRPHPLVAKWLASDRRRFQLGSGLEQVPPADLRASTPNSGLEWRRYRILDALFKALERRGARISEGNRRELIAELQGENIVFQLREKQKQIRRLATGAEGDRRVNVDRNLGKDVRPTAKMVFTINTFMPDGLRSEWLESDESPLEGLLPDIVATLLTSVPLLAERTRARELAERERRADEQRRNEQHLLRKLDDNRWRHFIELAYNWRDAQIAQNFLQALNALELDRDRKVGDQTLRDWLNWAEKRLRAREPTNDSLAALFSSVASVTAWTYRD